MRKFVLINSISQCISGEENWIQIIKVRKWEKFHVTRVSFENSISELGAVKEKISSVLLLLKLIEWKRIFLEHCRKFNVLKENENQYKNQWFVKKNLQNKKFYHQKYFLKFNLKILRLKKPLKLILA